MVPPLTSSGLLVGRVTLERAGQGEFAELVADHLVGDVDRHVLLAVVHRDRQADEIGQDRRAARPGLDRLLVLVGRALSTLATRWWSTNGPFLSERVMSWPLTSCGARRSSSACACCCACGSPWSACSTATPDAWPSPVRPSPPPCGWSTGFIATPRTVGRMPASAGAGLAVAGAGCAPRSPPRRSWRGSRCGSCAPRRSAGGPARRCLRAPAA